jgi:hypothetical protein
MPARAGQAKAPRQRVSYAGRCGARSCRPSRSCCSAVQPSRAAARPGRRRLHSRWSRCRLPVRSLSKPRGLRCRPPLRRRVPRTRWRRGSTIRTSASASWPLPRSLRGAPPAVTSTPAPRGPARRGWWSATPTTSTPPRRRPPGGPGRRPGAELRGLPARAGFAVACCPCGGLKFVGRLGRINVTGDDLSAHAPRRDALGPPG